MRKWITGFLVLLGLLLVSGTALAVNYTDCGELPLDGSELRLSPVPQYIQLRFTMTEAKMLIIKESNPYAKVSMSLWKAGADASMCGKYSETTVNGNINGFTGALLMPGDYFVRVSSADYASNWSKITEICFSATLSPLQQSDPEPNNSFAEAKTLPLPLNYPGALCARDVDGVRFRLDQPDAVIVRLEYFRPQELRNYSNNLYPVKLSIEDNAGKTVYTETSKPTDAETTHSIGSTLLLPAGEYFVVLKSSHTTEFGYYYTFTATPGSDVKSIKMPRKYSLTCKFSYQMPVTIMPSYRLPSQLLWKSSKPSVASIDESGVITGLKNGTTTITARSENGKIKASCKVTVHGNVYSRGKPKRPKKKGVYIYTKSLRYRGDMLNVELYVYNRLGVKIPYRMFDEVDVDIYDAATGKLITSTSVEEWGKRGSLGNNNIAVFKTSFLTRRMDLDLGSGRYYATFDFGYGDNDDYDDDDYYT